jgi:heptosyltransferase-2
MTRLVVRLPNWLGDIVMALPALASVRARWPEAHLTVALPAPFAAFMHAVEGCDTVLPLAVGRGWRGGEAFARDVSTLRAGGFEAGLLLTNSFASARMLRDAGVPERWGYRADLRAFLLTRAVPRPSARVGAERHHARYYGHLVEALGCASPTYDVRLEIPGGWRDAASMLLAEAGVGGADRLVGFAPGAAYGTAKQWPPALVARVIARCLQVRGATCVLLGTAADAGPAAEILAAVAGAPRVVNLVGRTDLTTLAGVLARCAAVVCNDSGIMHLASVLGTHTVAVFGATDERATAPLGPHELVVGDAWCRPCLRRECPIDHRCMWSITPDRVFERLQDRALRSVDTS